MKIKIKRQENFKSKAYWQTFDYTNEKPMTVVGILDELNYRDDLHDDQGNPVPRIRFECSCMQKMCGGCAMVIDGIPALACSTFVNPKEKEVLTLEPLSKFPVISDLMVDRSCILEYAKAAELYLVEKADPSQKEAENQYQVSKCLKCGLCLEACPNYIGPNGDFYGAVFANESYLLHTETDDRKKHIEKEYAKHFGRGCSKILSCMEICPMKIPTLSSIGYMNKKA